ncbi:divalent cation tolerance protein CutA [Pseudodesulfovibrio sp. JC047]|uniref:divalent-cation tolerance protein CutA n=1 Tax=Pseudodesulfovibrio sp. JC047 TaxID=2683199 RepID=UPI0013D30A51|nr:divalent-cation tolerance protein CutA [Pseudodesulfovibrio sp. JC047]NDV20187.1 divalent cation tolerance protein CutA [Pseudodesulfovibrio sp. JC047]
MAASFVYMTCSTMVEAENIATILVERRLVACANIMEGMKSIYWWEGAVHRAEEAVLVVKTRSDLVPELTEAVKAMHEYAVPCIVAMPIHDGNPDFLQWIQAETRAS